jgi:hypothetical protein
VHPPAAAHVNKLAGDPVRLFRSQESNRIGHIFRRPAPSQRRSAAIAPPVPSSSVGLDRPEGEDVYGDSILAELCGGPAPTPWLAPAIKATFPSMPGLIMMCVACEHDDTPRRIPQFCLLPGVGSSAAEHAFRISAP